MHGSGKLVRWLLENQLVTQGEPHAEGAWLMSLPAPALTAR